MISKYMCLMYIEWIKSLESNANKDERFNIYFYEHKSYITIYIFIFGIFFNVYLFLWINSKDNWFVVLSNLKCLFYD